MNFPDWTRIESFLICNHVNGSKIVEQDGYLLTNAWGYEEGGQIYVNGMTVGSGRSGHEGTYDHDCNFIPVKKGDLIEVYRSYTYAGAYIYFMPFRR